MFLSKNICNSPLPSSSYQFSTLWGVYLSGGTEHLEVQLRDYPWKLLEGESIGVSGRLLFAEQEAQQRGTAGEGMVDCVMM